MVIPYLQVSYQGILDNSATGPAVPGVFDAMGKYSHTKQPMSSSTKLFNYFVAK